MYISTEGIVAVCTALGVLASKFGIDKFLNKRSMNDKLLDLLNQNNSKFNDISSNIILLNQNISNLNSIIEKSYNNITVKNKEVANLIVSKFGESLKRSFINSMVDIFEVNHMNSNETPNKIKMICEKLIHDFYSECFKIEGMKSEMHSINIVLDCINKKDFYSKTYLLLETYKTKDKSANDIRNSELKQSLANFFDLMLFDILNLVCI